jgi:orotidine-5'-phosphate decarboxylase
MTAAPRDLPTNMQDRLIVALDVPTIAQAEALIDRLDGVASFFKIGLWLAFAEGVDALLRRLTNAGKRVFLDAKMYDIGKTVEEGVARAADRGVTFLTVHGDGPMIEAAMKGKGSSDLKVMAVTVLTSLDDAALRSMGYAMGAADLVALRVRDAVRHGCDGIIASAQDDPNAIRALGGNPGLLIATPGIRGPSDALDDHRRSADAGSAIARGADYLVVGRPIISYPDPAARAREIIARMQAGARGIA